MMKDLPTAVERGTFRAADGMSNQIQERVRSDWSNAESQQVGFNLFNFNRIIDKVHRTEDNSWSILSLPEMGTEEDFERIAGIPNLWHMGMRMGDSFRRLVLSSPGVRASLAEERSAAWGDKEPQWWFLNYGNQGRAGAYPTHAGTYSIETVAFTSSQSVREIVERSVNEYLVQRGILV
jgi:hypothetical protein